MARHAFQVDGSKIAEARLAAGMTQSELAREVETSERNIARWEGGFNQPRIEAIAKIAAATDKPIDFFLRPGVDNGRKLLAELEQINTAEAEKITRKAAGA